MGNYEAGRAIKIRLVDKLINSQNSFTYFTIILVASMVLDFTSTFNFAYSHRDYFLTGESNKFFVYSMESGRWYLYAISTVLVFSSWIYLARYIYFYRVLGVVIFAPVSLSFALWYLRDPKVIYAFYIMLNLIWALLIFYHVDRARLKEDTSMVKQFLIRLRS